MRIERVRAALMKLEWRGSVEKVLSLMEVRTNPALATDPDYQRTFNGYYKMGRKKDAFYRHFFSMLRESAYAPSPPSLRDNPAEPICQYLRRSSSGLIKRRNRLAILTFSYREPCR